MKEQLKIKKEIEGAYNKGMTPGSTIEIITPEAFRTNEKGEISGHIYNLCAFARSTEVITSRILACIINALVSRGVEVYKSDARFGVVLVKDSYGKWHELYRCRGNERGIQIFADSSFEYHPKETADPNKKVCVVSRRGSTYGVTIELFFSRVLYPITLGEK